MPGLRLLTTGAAMAAVAAALDVLAPAPSAALATLGSAQPIATTAGADVVVLAAVGLSAWLAWAWGVLGLALTAATALPGAAGAVARGATRVLLPASLRSGAAVALGMGLVVAAPVPVHAAPAAASGGPVLDRPTGGDREAPAVTPGAPVPDWPTGGDREAPAVTSGAPVPDWPTGGDRESPAVPDWPEAEDPAALHVVVRGDCLWHIAAERLGQAGVRQPTDGDVATAVDSWWQANRAVIGPDPDLIHPGQVLRPPVPPPDPTPPGELR